MINLRTVQIGSSTKLGSATLFSQERFLSASRPSPAPAPAPQARKSLGETEQAWYTRAKAAVVKYDGLVDRMQKMPAASAALGSKFHGDGSPTSGAALRNTLAARLLEAEGFQPHNYAIFGQPAVQSKVEQLENLDRDFEAAVSAAEKVSPASSKSVSGPASMQSPNLGVDTQSVVCAAAGLVLVGTIFYFAFAKKG